MAKKRVHEIAKERGISSKEVIAVLQKAGLDVKAAASSVDERDIARAFSPGGNGAEAGGAEQTAGSPDAPADDRGAAPQRPAGEGAGDVALVHARRGRLHVQAGLLKDRDDLLAGDPALLGYFVYALLGHSSMKCKRLSGIETEPRRAL